MGIIKQEKNQIIKGGCGTSELLKFILGRRILLCYLRVGLSKLKSESENGLYNEVNAISTYLITIQKACELYQKEFGYTFNDTQKHNLAAKLEKYYFNRLEIPMKKLLPF